MISIVFEIARGSSAFAIWEYIRYRIFLQTESFPRVFLRSLEDRPKSSLQSAIGAMLDRVSVCQS